MGNEISLERCRAYLQSQIDRKDRVSEAKKIALPFVTISRQAGAGGITVARLLSDYLRESEGDGIDVWEVFDQNLVQKVLKDHHLSHQLETFMPEDSVSEVEDLLGDVLGAHPPTLSLVRKTCGTLEQLASIGRVILVGRGANVVTRNREGGFHVRLVGSEARRVGHLMSYYGFSQAKAVEFARQEDEGRRRYLQKYFNRNIDDPLLYDLIINTDRFSYKEAARTIGQAVLNKKVEKGQLP